MSEPAKKGKTSTLTILLAVIGGGALLMVLVIGVVVWRVMASPGGRAIVGVMGETMTVMKNAQKAKGTKELRGIGCKTAMVLDLEDFERITQKLDAGAQRQGPKPFGKMVSCAVSPWSTPPTCEAVAATYLAAADKLEDPFVVSVSRSGQPKPACSELRAPDGTKLRDTATTETDGFEPPAE